MKTKKPMAMFLLGLLPPATLKANREKAGPPEVDEVILPSWFYNQNRGYDYECYKKNYRDRREVLKSDDLFKAKPKAVMKNVHSGDVNMIGTFHRCGFLRIVISDMLYSLGAKHYYGKIELPDVHWHKVTEPNMVTFGGGLPPVRHIVEATGRLTQKEITSDPERYKCWKAGHRYPGFLTEKEAYDACMNFVKDYTKGFQIEVEGYTPL